MRAMVAPVLSHLDPDMLALLDDVRARLTSVFQAPEDALSLAISGTGTAGMEAAVANMVREGSHVLVVVNGYFGERLADMCLRYGALVNKVEVPWGRAVDPDAVRRALRAGGADIVAVVHAETSTGVLNPVDAIAEVAREFNCLTLVDAVTSLAAHPVDVKGWKLDARSTAARRRASARRPVSRRSRSARRRARDSNRPRGVSISIWRCSRTSGSDGSITTPSRRRLIYALREALLAIDEEGLEQRWARHRRHHLVLAAGIGAMGLELLPPEGERLVDALNAVCVPDGVDEAAVRRYLLELFNLEIGAGPRSARRAHLARRLDGIGVEQPADPAVPERARTRRCAHRVIRVPPGTGTAAAGDALSTFR